jgi:cbb3-type cytochrome oxidase subunit 3
MRVRKKSVVRRVVYSLGTSILCVFVFCCFFGALGTVEKGQRKEEEKRIAELQRQADKAALEARIKQQEEQTAARLQNAEEAVTQKYKNS